MKATSLFKNLTLVSCMLILAASCIKKVEVPPFYNESYAFHIVQVSLDDQDPTSVLYEPFFGVKCGGEDISPEKSSITKNGVKMINEAVSGNNVYQVDASINASGTLLGLNGEYTFDPISVNDNTFKRSREINFVEEIILGEVKVTDYKYENGHLKATFDKVENATYYAFYIQPLLNNEITEYYYLYRFTTAEIISELSQKVEFRFNMVENNLQKAYITPVAIVRSEEGQYMIRKADRGRYLTATKDSFD